MKRAEFLKRLGLGAVAAVAAPALLAKEEPEIKASELSENGKEMAFWRSSDKAVISSAFTATACYTLEIPPLKEGEYDYVLEHGKSIIMQGKIKSV